MTHKKNSIHIAGHITYAVLYGSLIVSAFLFYNRADLEILLYPGWIILALGVCFLLLASRSRKKEYTLEGIGKEIPVEDGMYAFVRHPGFLGHILVILALIMIGQHWFNLIIGAAIIVLLYLAMIEEEKRNIEKFGGAYELYIQKVPRMNLPAGIIRQIHYKKGNERGR